MSLADRAVTLPILRWTWTGLSDKRFESSLVEFRPTDPETVQEMMAGRYLLASRLVDTEGASPFSVAVADPEWFAALHDFSWLRHFRDIRDPGQRSFARTLVLDWIAHGGRFRPDSWSVGLCAQRIMNWLRHSPLLMDGATPDQAAIARSLRTQIQSVRLRERLTGRPVDSLLAAIALVGVALCDEEDATDLERRLRKLQQRLADQVDGDGLYRTRDPGVQFDLLVELVTLRQSLAREHPDLARQLGGPVDGMHRALDALTPGTGEPGYFHGCGQVPHDLLVAVQAQGPVRRRSSGLVGGYALLMSGKSNVIADTGLVPPLPYAETAHASALAFEFSRGTELVFGNCGPISDLEGAAPGWFREGIAHSSPTIDNRSAAHIPARGGLGGRLRPIGLPPTAELDVAQASVLLRSDAYAARFGAAIERRITLLSEGTTLVGEDRIVKAGRGLPSGLLTARFHLAPGAHVRRGTEEELLLITLPEGSLWTFLWEGAEVHLENSVRQSAHFGFHRTRQIVLEAPVQDGHEIAWIFALNEGTGSGGR